MLDPETILKLTQAFGPAVFPTFVAIWFMRKLNGKMDAIGELVRIQEQQVKTMDKLSDALTAHNAFAVQAVADLKRK